MYFHYGADGLTGFELNNVNYLYKKNAQNDILSICDINGNELVKYIYDAWGNHKAKYLSNNGEWVDLENNKEYNDIGNVNQFVASKNPFRYRSYYIVI